MRFKYLFNLIEIPFVMIFTKNPTKWTLVLTIPRGTLYRANDVALSALIFFLT